eukprot:1141043-Pelagomonas_calceolata.AAC.2
MAAQVKEREGPLVVGTAQQQYYTLQGAASRCQGEQSFSCWTSELLAISMGLDRQAQAEKCSALCLRAHALKIETSLWQEHTHLKDFCTFVLGLPLYRRHTNYFWMSQALFIILASSEDAFHFLQKKTNETCHFIFDLMDTFHVAGTVEQAEQPNYLAEVQNPIIQ